MAPSSVATVADTASQSQYHHYVPQFLLKNYSHPYQPPGYVGTKAKRHRQKKKGKFEKGKHPGDSVLNRVNLEADPLIVEEVPVKRVLGQVDMYRDPKKPTEEQMGLERRFRDMENKASSVFREIVRALEKGSQSITLRRDDRNLVRKFLFLLKFRGLTFNTRFRHETADAYDADDKEMFVEYMDRKGYTRPLDVWFDTLETIMDLEMDPRKEWVGQIHKKMYRPDASWFVFHVEMAYMAFCTPADPDDEFILTDNSYNVFEGPQSQAMNPSLGKIENLGWFQFHEFAPVSPKLMVILRSILMPSEDEKWSSKLRMERETIRGDVFRMWESRPRSSLEDLPIVQPRPSYLEHVGGVARLRPGETGEWRRDHEFCFTFFPVGTKHVDRINGILLDNSHRCTSIVFGTRGAFFRTFENYMNSPCDGWKMVLGSDADERRHMLQAYKALLAEMGSQKESVWVEGQVPEFAHFDTLRKKIFWMERLRLKELEGESPTGEKPRKKDQAYFQLGGTWVALIGDLEQVTRMQTLRIKIDVWSQGIDEDIRQRNRDLLEDAYMRMHPRRVMLYVKRIRFMKLSRGWHDGSWTDLDSELLDGPEDVIARGARRLAGFEDLNRMMFVAAENDTLKRMNPDMNTWGPFLANMQGGLEFGRACKFIFRASITSCGIPEILGLLEPVLEAHLSRPRPPMQSLHLQDIIMESQMVELQLWIRVRMAFRKVLSEKVPEDLMDEFERAFFGVVYPTPEAGGRFRLPSG